MALAMPVRMPKQSARLAAQLNSPPLTWIAQSVALRKGTTPGSRRWINAPRDRKSSAPWGGMRRAVSMFPPVAVSGPRAGPVGVEDALAVRAAVGVRAEEVALPLGDVGGQALRAIRVVIGQRGAQGGHGDAQADGGLHHMAPRRL